MVTFHCASCGRQLRVQQEHAGKKARCPDCGQVSRVPAREPVGAVAQVKVVEPQVAPFASPATDGASEHSSALYQAVLSQDGQPTPVENGASSPGTMKRPLPADASPALSSSTPVPISEQWYLKTTDEQTYGPVDKQQLESWVVEGRVTSDCQVLREGAAEWRWAGDVFPVLVAQSLPAAPTTHAYVSHAPRPSYGEVTVPLLISAIGNIVVGMFWLITCYGFILAVPMFVLCAMEFDLHSKANRMSPGELGRRAQGVGIFEIIMGMFNGISLICGILVLVGSSKLQKSGYQQRY